MAFTARLPDGLGQEAKLLAEDLGISLNALLAVSLRDYVDARRRVPLAVEPVPVPAPSRGVLPPKSRADPCPCGARDPNGRPVKFKHCHGKAL